jgi:hypothetical protein
MDRQFIEEKGIKDWHKNLDHKHYIMFGDDIDSWVSTYILYKLFGCQIALFYDFGNIYHREGIDITKIMNSKLVGVDVDLAKNKCFGNHVTYIENPDCISLNRGIEYGNNNYLNKFAGSTLITILSLYDIDLSGFTVQQLEILISVDTAFKQYFFNSRIFKYYYEDVLEYPLFVEIVKGKTKNYFYDIIVKYGLHEKISIDDDGYLQTKIKLNELSEIFNIDLSLPQDKYIHFYDLQDRGMDLTQIKDIDPDKIFSSAVTNRNFVKASIKYER